MASATISDLQMHRSARDHGRRVTVDDDGREGFNIDVGVRLTLAPIPADAEMIGPDDD